MRLTERQLRKIIREELAGATQTSQSAYAPTYEFTPEEHAAADARSSGRDPSSGVRARADNSGAMIDLRPIQDDMINLADKATELYKKSQGSLVTDQEWQELEPSHRFSNAIVKAVRGEILKMTREMQMEDEKPWEW